MPAEGVGPQPVAGDQRFESWKEIAAYLKREVRTVQRWEKSEGLPVHRHLHEKAGSVYAFRSEIDAWWRQRQEFAETDSLSDETDSAEAQQSDAAAEPDLSTTPPQTQAALIWKWIAIGATTVLLVIAAIAGYRHFKRDRFETGKAVIAIAPFRNLGGDPDQQYFAAGLTEEMIARLARVEPARITVVGLTSTYAQSSPKQLAEQFRADFVLTGSVRHARTRVAVTAQLVNAKTQADVWSDSYERDVSDVLRIQDEIATSIASEVRGTLPAGSGPPRAVNPDAYIAYLKGRFFWNKRSTQALFRAIEYFQDSATRDPTYAPAYAGIADSYNLLGSLGYAALPPRDAFPKAIAAARKAISLDPNLAEAHVSLGYAKFAFDWDVSGGRREFERAIKLDPNYATAHQYYGYELMSEGRFDDAIRELHRAEELDPLSAVIASAVGEAYYFHGQFDRTIEQDKKSLELNPAFGLGIFNLARAYSNVGRHDEAIALYRQALASGEEPGLLAGLAYEYAVTGQRAQTQEIVSRLNQLSKSRYVPAIYFALIYTGSGDTGKALSYLQRAYDERCDYFIDLSHEPMADPIRNNPAFIRLMKKTGLPR